MQAALRHPSTGKFKFIGTGWSWRIFLGAAFLGLPLFFRGMAMWGTVMFALWFSRFALPYVVTGPNAVLAAWLPSLAILGVSLFLGFRGNALSARHFIACGYDFAEPDSDEARFAAARWGV